MDLEERIAHHAAVLMYHDTGQSSYSQSVQRFAELWGALVPDRGHADTVHGEVLRAVGRLASEDRRNGCMNWGEDYEGLVVFLRGSLPDEAIFGASRCTRIVKDLDTVVRNGRDGADGETIRITFGRLIEDAVVRVSEQ